MRCGALGPRDVQPHAGLRQRRGDASHALVGDLGATAIFDGVELTAREFW